MKSNFRSRIPWCFAAVFPATNVSCTSSSAWNTENVFTLLCGIYNITCIHFLDVHCHTEYCFLSTVGWFVCCLLAGLDLWKRMPLKCSITMIFTCLLLSSCTISSLFGENNNVVVFPFPFHIFMPLTKLWFVCLQE